MHIDVGLPFHSPLTCMLNSICFAGAILAWLQDTSHGLQQQSNESDANSIQSIVAHVEEVLDGRTDFDDILDNMQTPPHTCLKLLLQLSQPCPRFPSFRNDTACRAVTPTSMTSDLTLSRSRPAPQLRGGHAVEGPRPPRQAAGGQRRHGQRWQRAAVAHEQRRGRREALAHEVDRL
jgi:hypothetical protein